MHYQSQAICTQKQTPQLTIYQKKAVKIIQKCLEQNKQFKKYQSQKNWYIIHSSHYDWWAFPIDQRSSYGNQYKVFRQQQQFMKKRQDFMNALPSNAIIVCQAWGYDLQKGEFIKTQDPDQSWQDWPIRLYKMARSLQIFGFDKLFRNAIKYGIELMRKDYLFEYGRRKLSEYFKDKWRQIEMEYQQKGQNKNKIQQKERIQKESSQNKVKVEQQLNTIQNTNNSIQNQVQKLKNSMIE